MGRAPGSREPLLVSLFSFKERTTKQKEKKWKKERQRKTLRQIFKAARTSLSESLPPLDSGCRASLRIDLSLGPEVEASVCLETDMCPGSRVLIKIVALHRIRALLTRGTRSKEYRPLSSPPRLPLGGRRRFRFRPYWSGEVFWVRTTGVWEKPFSRNLGI